MKSIYITPETELEAFESADILTASGVTDPDYDGSGGAGDNNA